MSEAPEVSAAQLLDEVRALIGQVKDPDAVLADILKQAVQATGADRGMFAEATEGGALEFRVLSGFQSDAFQGTAGAFSRSLFAEVLATGEDVMLRRAVDHPKFESAASVQAIGTASILCMPIRIRDRFGALVYLEKRQPACFDESHRALLRSKLMLSGPLIEAVQVSRDVVGERERLRSSEGRLRQEAESNREALASQWSFGRFVGRSGPVRELEAQVLGAADSTYPVVLLGETGTGKTLLARTLHNASKRARRPFMTVFCPALEKSMLEAELFGSKPGAFTGAVDRVGKVEAAEGGTLFLDEIGELPLEIQPKLFRLLSEETFERLGETRERRADVQVIAATNRDLKTEVKKGRFREELFHRLNYLQIRVPSLRERAEDIPAILRYCLDQNDAGRWVQVSPEAERWLTELDFMWPGNVRHLQQLAARLVLARKNGPASAADLARLLDVRDDEGLADDGRIDYSGGLPAHLMEMEKKFIQQVIQLNPDLTRAEQAKLLKISEATFYKKLKDHGLSE